MDADLFAYLLRIADDRLVLGHRLSEWCGHGPILEEDIALANISLDLVGQANHLLQLAGSVEGAGRDQDRLAYFREAVEYRNALICELPRGDFAFTIVRQLVVAARDMLLFDRLAHSARSDLSGIAAKALKEVRYHARHSADWIVKLGDGTEESHRRAQRALDDLWRYTGELFDTDGVERRLVERGIGVDSSTLAAEWRAQVAEVVERATLKLPADGYMMRGGRVGRHTEHLGHMLAEMQIVARSFPGAKW
ncbi:MAG: 1,2-phenylacetyl-CoA epoxidase, subunit C [Gemmatimonadaceae bacterium]|nr:1,2-phenylacetyl-CoA epoxidase, subunit C [Gemmatimonadaceae bacterium]